MIREHDEILRSTVRLARLAFAAAAASVFLYDHEREALVFEASSGVGEDRLVGVAIPPDRGIAGWVANTGEALLVSCVADDDRFDRKFAAETGLVPDVIMAAPLENDGEVIGVLEVLDPKLDSFGDMRAIDMLTELAAQSCAALSLLLTDRRAQARRGARRDAAAMLAALPAAAGGGGRSEAVDELLAAVCRLVAENPPGRPGTSSPG